MLVVLAAAATLADEDPDVREILEKPRAGPVLYLVELVQDGGRRPDRRDGGVVLANPIADDEGTPDGVYFRPADGKEVEEGTVSVNLGYIHCQ